jgi:hypothetical protein
VVAVVRTASLVARVVLAVAVVVSLVVQAVLEPQVKVTTVETVARLTQPLLQVVVVQEQLQLT